MIKLKCQRERLEVHPRMHNVGSSSIMLDFPVYLGDNLLCF